MRLVLPRLYVILDAALLTHPELEMANSLADAGVRLLQYRNKQASARELFEKSRGLAEELLPRQVTFLVNDRADVAALVGASGVHVGQDDLGVEAARGLVGQASGVGVFGIPPDQRFYAGGSATVRGYRYQTLGPQFPDEKPTGGTAISTGTVELRQRILGNYGVVGFVDVGQVSANGAPFTSNWHAGTGVGARYYTPIGPIRLDVAVPLDKLPGGDSFELYIGIGQAF